MFKNSRRGRTAFGQLEELKNFAELVTVNVRKHTDHLFNSGHAEKAANDILKDASRARPKYNNYSGNLNRSYMVKVRLGHTELEYMTPENVAAKPLVHSQVTLPTQRWAGRFDRPRERAEVEAFKETKKGRKAEWLKNYETIEELTRRVRKSRLYFRLRKQRHSIKRSMKAGRRKGNYNNRRDRFLRAIKNVEMEYQGNGFIHRYRERMKYDIDSKRYVAANPAKNKIVYQVSLMNLTPYAGAVEKHGYRVLDYGRTSHYGKIVQKAFGQAVTTSVKWTCDQMERNKLGRFTRKI